MGENEIKAIVSQVVSEMNSSAEEITKMYPNNKKLEIIGPYSDKQNKDKTSDIYDAISIGVAFAKSYKDGNSDG